MSRNGRKFHRRRHHHRHIDLLQENQKFLRPTKPTRRTNVSKLLQFNLFSAEREHQTVLSPIAPWRSSEAWRHTIHRTQNKKLEKVVVLPYPRVPAWVRLPLSSEPPAARCYLGMHQCCCWNQTDRVASSVRRNSISCLVILRSSILVGEGE